MAKSVKNLAGEASKSLAHVTWEDHCQRHGWMEVEEIEKSKPLMIHSVGIKLFEDDRVLVLSNSVSEEMAAISPLVILKNCITFRKDFNLKGFKLGA